MPFVAAPNIIMTEIRYTLFAQQIENRVMVDNLAAPSTANLEAVAIAVWNWAEASLMPLVSNQLHLREVVCTDIGAIDGGQVTYAPDTTTVGAVGGAMLPNETAFCVSLRSTSRGRSARGRIYYPAISVNSCADPNNLTPTAAGNFATATQGLINAITALSKELVIVSYRSEGVARPGGPVYYPVVSATASDTVLDSQRRRKPGNGT